MEEADRQWYAMVDRLTEAAATERFSGIDDGAREVGIDAFDSRGKTALHTAVETGKRLSLIQILCWRPDVNLQDQQTGDTPLHVAARCHEGEMARYLIKAGADLTVYNSRGESPLDLAADDLKEDMQRWKKQNESRWMGFVKRTPPSSRGIE